MALSSASAARILIVDDQEANVALLRDLLEQAGYTAIETITDSREAAGVFAAFQPDLTLLDLLMPNVNGFGVLAQLKPLISADEFCPILVLTADLSAESKRRALGEGATDFLRKPLDTLEVLLRVRTLLHTRALHRRLHDQNGELEERVRKRTLELEEARAQVLELYRELARRNQDLQLLIEQLMPNRLPAQSPSGGHEQHQHPMLDALTPRERDVLLRLAHGQTNKEIAAELFLGTATVKWHVEHIIDKLGVTGRTQAAMRAVELGLLAGSS